MIYRVEVWQFSSDEEPCEEEMINSHEFESQHEAMTWAWDRMEEGFQTRLYRF